MSEDQFQRHVDFIVAQQAKFTTDIGKLEENLARHEQENREVFAKLGDIILSLANYNQEQDERIASHGKQIAELIEHGSETDRRFRETDERINALITMAERFFNKNGILGMNQSQLPKSLKRGKQYEH